MKTKFSEQEQKVIGEAARNMLRKVLREEMPEARRAAARKVLQDEAWPLTAMGRDRVEDRVEKGLVERLAVELVAYQEKEWAEEEGSKAGLDAAQLEAKFYDWLKSVMLGKVLVEALVAGLHEEQLMERFVKMGLKPKASFGLLNFLMKIHPRVLAASLLAMMGTVGVMLAMGGRLFGGLVAGLVRTFF